jgi:dolichyl-phosphate beta-glucosyltransferase
MIEGAKSVSIVIPCYNEAARLQSEEFLNALSSLPNVKLLFVDDGSSDDTESLLVQLVNKLPQQIDSLILPTNMGKGEAVRQGMLHLLSTDSDIEWFGFFDADLATPLSEIPFLLSFATTNTQALLGSRVKRLGARVKRLELRHYFGRISATLVSRLLRLPIYDSQCGAKLFRPALAALAFAKPFKTRWLFDVEILARGINAYSHQWVIDSIVEVPVRCWIEQKGSKIRFTDILLLPFQLHSIKRAYSLK